MKKIRSKKIVRAGIGISIGFISLFVAAAIFISQYVPHLIKKKISQLVIEGSDSLYQCSVGKVSVNFWLSKVTVEDVYITVDSTKYLQLKEKDNIPNTTFELMISKTTINRLKIIPLLLSKKIFIESLLVQKTNAIFCLHVKKDRPPPKLKKPVWRMIEPFAKGLYINTIIIDNFKLSYSPLEDKKSQSFSYQDGSMSLSNIRIDSAGGASRSRILYTESISIKLFGIKYYTPDSLYYIKIDTFNYSSLERNLELKQFVLKPTLPLIQFTIKNGMQIDLFDVVIPEVRGTNLKMERLFINNEICFDTIQFKSPIVKINRDRNAHYDTTSQIGKYPNEALLKAPFTIKVPMVIIEDAKLHYIERQKLTLKTGDAYFTKINGYISNITNSKTDLQQNGHCIMALKGYFMKHGKLKIKLDFDLSSGNGNYYGSAQLGSMTSTELNRVFIPFANVRLKSLSFNKGQLTFIGNNKGIIGSAKLLYDHLKIEILTVNKKTHRIKKRGFVSFFANLFAIRAHNKEGKHEVMANNIYVQRKRRQPFGNLLWEFLFESMKKIILKVPAKNLKAEM